MDEDEILDAPEGISEVKIKRWLTILLSILFIALGAILVRQYSFYIRHYPEIKRSIDFLTISLFTIILFFSIKKTKFHSIHFLIIYGQSTLIIFGGVCLSIFLNSIFSISSWSYNLSYYLQLLLGSAFTGSYLSWGILKWLKNKNYWLLPILVTLLIGLIFLGDYLTQVNPDNHDW